MGKRKVLGSNIIIFVILISYIYVFARYTVNKDEPHPEEDPVAECK